MTRAEWTAGYRSGMLHDCHDLTCKDNIKKASEAIARTDVPRRVKEYWAGYLDGTRDRAGCR